jgi:hypothetical protein
VYLPSGAVVLSGSQEVVMPDGSSQKPLWRWTSSGVLRNSRTPRNAKGKGKANAKAGRAMFTVPRAQPTAASPPRSPDERKSPTRTQKDDVTDDHSEASSAVGGERVIERAESATSSSASVRLADGSIKRPSGALELLDGTVLPFFLEPTS